MGGGAAGARSSSRSGLSRTTPGRAEPAARGYFVEPYSDAVRLERDLDLGGAGALGKLWSTTGDLARWGAFLAAGDDRVLAAATLEEMAHVRAMVDHAALDARRGARGSSSTARGEHVFVGHGGAMPGHLAGLVVNRKTRIGAAVLTNTGRGRDAGEARARPGDGGASTRCRRRRRGLAAGRAGARRRRAAARPLVDGGPRARVLVAEGQARGEARRRRRPAGTPRSSSADGDDRWRVAEGRERGELLRVVRDADGEVEKLYFATYPLRARAVDLLDARSPAA